jgi:hypothetical protein
MRKRYAELEDEADVEIAEKYGGILTNMKGRRHLSQKAASIFIFCYFYRRGC